MDADEQRGGAAWWRSGPVRGSTAAEMYEMGMSGGVGPAMGSTCAVAVGPDMGTTVRYVMSRYVMRQTEDRQKTCRRPDKKQRG